MGLESGTYIDSLNASNPVGATDPKSQGDDHIRLIKSTILNTFPNVVGEVSLTHTQINSAAIKTEANELTVSTSGSDYPLKFKSALPGFAFEDTGEATNEKVWDFLGIGGDFTIRTRTDAYGAGQNALQIVRNGTTVTNWRLTATAVEIYSGSILRVLNSGNTDYTDLSHNGTDLIIASTNTTWLRFRDQSNGLIFEDGAILRAYDSLNTDYGEFYCDGTYVRINSSGNAAFRFNGAPVWVTGGVGLEIYDSGGSDKIKISHDGTNAILAFTNSTYCRFDGLGTGILLEDGPLVRIYDDTNSDYFQIEHDGTDVNFTTQGTTEVNLDKPVNSPNLSAAEWGYKGAPHNEQNGNYTLILADAGKRIYKASGGAGETITIPANASVAFPVGTIIEIINDGGGDLSVAITTDTLEELATGSTGTRTLPDNNKAIIEKVTSTVWKYSATG